MILLGKGSCTQKEFSRTTQYCFFFEACAICAVNVFVLITGYYSVEKKSVKLNKIAIILIQTSIMQLIAYLIRVLFGQLNITLEGVLASLFGITNWYVWLYLTLYVLIPYINVLINNLTETKLKSLVLLLFLLFSVIAFASDLYKNITEVSVYGLSTISMYGNESGYTIVNFVLCYCLGAFLKKLKANDVGHRHSKKWNLVACILTFVMSTFVIYGISKYWRGIAWQYCSPFVIINSVCLFLAF